MKKKDGYKYFLKDHQAPRDREKDVENAVLLGRERLNPSWSNPDFLLYRRRRELFSNWLLNLPSRNLKVLDVGGRIQPYRPLLEGRLEYYWAVDPILGGLVDIIAVGEHLPFCDDSFDLVFCTQVLGYVDEPAKVISELYRVMQPGGLLLLSAPALFPLHHDERWRFLPDGLRVLFSRFARVEILPEGYSISGLFRTTNVCFNIFVQKPLFRKLIAKTLIPILNFIGMYFDRLSNGNDRFTTNFSCLARK